MTMVEAIRATLRAEMDRDERVVVLGQDVGRLGGVFRATDGLQERFGADRVIDMPLAEAAIVGASAGLALSGLVPVPEIQFLGFAHQAFHQIGPQLARYRQRSRGRYTMPVTIRAPFGGGIHAPELHSDAHEGLYVQCPGLKVVAPATVADARGMLISAIRDPDPVLFCEPLHSYRSLREDLQDGDGGIVPFGTARTARTGDDVTIVAWSAAVQIAERAADLLAQAGVHATVLDLRSLVPLDVDALLTATARTGRVVVVHEAPLTGGFGAEIAATIAQEALYYLEVPVLRVTPPDVPYPMASMEDHYLPSPERVATAARRLVESP